MSWDFESGLGGWFSLGDSFAFSKRQSSDGLAGDGEVTFKMTSSYGWKVASTRAKDPRNKEEGTTPLNHLEVTHHYLCYISLVTQRRPDPMWEELTQGHRQQESSLRSSLKLGIHAVILSLTDISSPIMSKMIYYRSSYLIIDRDWKKQTYILETLGRSYK